MLRGSRSVAMPNLRTQLILEQLEDRCTPAAITYIEDFSSDIDRYDPGFDQFDTDPGTADIDEFLIYNTLTDGAAGPTNGPSGSNGYYAIMPDPTGRQALSFYDLSGSGAAFSFFLNVPALPGTVPAGMICAGFSLEVGGSGAITVQGRDANLTVEFSSFDRQLLSFSSRTLSDEGVPLGPLASVNLWTTTQIDLDNVAVTVDELSYAAGEGNVRVRTLGPDLGIMGDEKSNAIQVQMLDVSTGTIRVLGLGGTTVNGQQEVVVTGVFRDAFINMWRGDDFVHVTGDPDNYNIAFTLEDDLLFDLDRGANTVRLDNVEVGDLLALQSRGGQDRLDMLRTTTNRLDVHTGGGQDTVTADAFSGQLAPVDVVAGPSFINTGGDADLIDLSLAIRYGLTVQLGGGKDLLVFRSQCFADVSFDLGDGNDTLELDHAEFEQELTVLMGDGQDVLQLNYPKFAATASARFRGESARATLDLFGGLYYQEQPAYVTDRVSFLSSLDVLGAPIVFNGFDFADV